MANQEELSLEERWLVDRFQSLLGEVRRKATAAPDGTVIDCIEGMFLDQGRELLRRAFEAEVQQQADLAEKKCAHLLQMQPKATSQRFEGTTADQRLGGDRGAPDLFRLQGLPPG